MRFIATFRRLSDYGSASNSRRIHMARFALNPDYRDFLSECNAHQIEYLVIGGTPSSSLLVKDTSLEYNTLAMSFFAGVSMFIDRADELAMLQQLLTRQRGGELLLLYGRRRVGKTALLRHWASQSVLPWTYW